MALKTIYAGLEVEKALVLRSLLNAHHIPCFMSNEHHASVEPSLQFALGGTSLVVPGICEQDARALIDAWPRQTLNDDFDQTQDDDLNEKSWKCSRCNFKESTKRISRVSSAIGVVSFFLAGFNQPFVPRQTVTVCAKCGHVENSEYYSVTKYWLFYSVVFIAIAFQALWVLI